MYSTQLYEWMLQAACLAWLWQQVLLHKEGRFHSEEAVALLRWNRGTRTKSLGPAVLPATMGLLIIKQS